MTYQQKYNENKKLIKNYHAFLEHVGDFDKRLKIITEIGRLNEQNKEIKQMTFEQVHLHINESKLKVNALLP